MGSLIDQLFVVITQVSLQYNKYNMLEVPDSKELSKFNISDFVVPPIEKYIERRGFMYVVYDSKFPEYIKVGRTSDCKKRLMGYNSDKPYPTSQMLYISKLFNNVHDIERKILQYLYDNTNPTTLSKEWFEIQHKEKIITIIEKAEDMETNEL